jgi:hypothetical protein
MGKALRNANANMRLPSIKMPTAPYCKNDVVRKLYAASQAKLPAYDKSHSVIGIGLRGRDGYKLAHTNGHWAYYEQGEPLSDQSPLIMPEGIKLFLIWIDRDRDPRGFA